MVRRGRDLRRYIKIKKNIQSELNGVNTSPGEEREERNDSILAETPS